LLNTGWFQERIRAWTYYYWYTFHEFVLILGKCLLPEATCFVFGV